MDRHGNNILHIFFEKEKKELSVGVEKFSWKVIEKKRKQAWYGRNNNNDDEFNVKTDNNNIK